jgi:SAM-dependent methyltransferase
VLTQVILQQTAPQKVIAIDPSSDYIGYAKAFVVDKRAEFVIGKVEDLDSNESTFDVAVAGLVLNFVPAPEQTLSTMQSLVKTGGTVAAYVWDYGGGMQMMRHFWDAAVKIDPVAIEQDAGRQCTFCDEAGLQTLFAAQGIVDIEVRALDADAHFSNFDDYWQPFLAAQGSVSRYLLSLDDKTLAAIREQIRSQLPIAADGTIQLVNRAWAVKGRLP